MKMYNKVRDYLMPKKTEKKAPKRRTRMLTIYKVVLPSWVVYPGEVILKVFYTKEAAVQYIETYPLKYLTPWMTIKEEEIIIFGTD